MKSKLSFPLLTIAALLSSFCAFAQLQLPKIWKSGEYAAKGIPGFASAKNGQSYTLLDFDQKTGNTSIGQYSYATGKKEQVLVDGSNLVNSKGDTIQLQGYEMSPDEQRVLIQTGTESIYRHSFVAHYYVYDLKTKTMKAISADKVMHSTFSPDSKKVAFVKNNNLWFYDITSGNEIQVTTDGERNKIINGSCDWVYEEEFSFTKAFMWSPNSDVIGYYRFDESKVREFLMTTYGPLYPEEYKYKYPKAGESNSDVSIHFYHLADRRVVNFDAGTWHDFYIPRLKWTSENQYAVVYVMNRLQNELVLYKTDVRTGTSTTLLKESNKYYVDVTDNLFFTSDKKHFLWSSELDGFHHLYLYNMDGSLVNQVTKGNWDIDDVAGIDEKKKLIYFTSSEVSPMERHLYVTGFDGKNKKQLSSRKGFHSITFNASNSLYVDNCSDLNTPPYITLNDTKGKQVRVLEDNKVLTDKLATLKLSRGEFIQCKAADGQTLNGWMIKPAVMEPDKKYPVLMFVYGGPGSQTVTDRWGGGNYLWYQYLAQNGYIVVSVDNRGTGFRGEQFKKCTYLELGKRETEDQVEAAKYLGTLPYIDKDRIGIFGWSYGGYMSSLCITKGADVFKAAIAVAPVTNWRYYDNIYTERYMRTPQENGSNYDNNSPINHIDKLKGKYLIIHGTADDNVHFQNSVEMVNSLIKANKTFDSEYYPNKNHGISGGNARLHIFSRISDFIFKNL